MEKNIIEEFKHEFEMTKDMYKDEYKKILKKGELSPADGDALLKILEGLEKIDKLCEKCDYISESGYSERSMSMQNRYPQDYYGSMPEMRMSERRGRNKNNGQYMSRHNNTEDVIDSMISDLEDLKMGLGNR